jgi:hypothetical protein
MASITTTLPALALAITQLGRRKLHLLSTLSADVLAVDGGHLLANALRPRPSRFLMTRREPALLSAWLKASLDALPGPCLPHW